jgi:sugar phosphate isomerase/epimerase
LEQSRRYFVKAGSASLIYGSVLAQSSLRAQTLKVPLGLQLYSVREILPKDYAGTLKQIGAIGYREVEAAGYFDHSAAEVKQAMSNAGLHLVSTHYSSDDLHQKLDEILAFSKGWVSVTLFAPSLGSKIPLGSRAFQTKSSSTRLPWKTGVGMRSSSTRLGQR